MDFREWSLQEALQKNGEETSRWTAFRGDQMQAIENLHAFQKHLEVEIMVPIGNKALLPGHLYHTNEVMVTHFNGIFSKCTVQKAHEILDARVEVANERLKALEAERELLVNRQAFPLDAFSTEEQQEIMEEYDEEKEREWRVQHRERVREHKKHEAEQRKAGKMEEEDFEGFLAKLEELEMLEELNNELADEMEDEELLNVEEPPPQEILQTKRKSLTFSDMDSVQVIEPHEAPCRASRQSDVSLNLNPDLTLHLEVNHTASVFSPPKVEDQVEITSPADIYRVFASCLEQERVPKSILKNKEAVEREVHLPHDVPTASSSKSRSKEIISVDHSSILGDVMERNPEEKQPQKSQESAKPSKRPASRFKAAREGNS